MSKFLRAASLGVQLNESWIVLSAAAYVWNYSSHAVAHGPLSHGPLSLSHGPQQKIVTSLQSILDAIKAVEIPRYTTFICRPSNIPV